MGLLASKMIDTLIVTWPRPLVYLISSLYLFMRPFFFIGATCLLWRIVDIPCIFFDIIVKRIWVELISGAKAFYPVVCLSLLINQSVELIDQLEHSKLFIFATLS